MFMLSTSCNDHELIFGKETPLFRGLQNDPNKLNNSSTLAQTLSDISNE